MLAVAGKKAEVVTSKLTLGTANRLRASTMDQLDPASVGKLAQRDPLHRATAEPHTELDDRVPTLDDGVVPIEETPDADMIPGSEDFRGYVGLGDDVRDGDGLMELEQRHWETPGDGAYTMAHTTACELAYARPVHGEPSMTISGHDIRSIRQRFGWSIEQFARLLGVHPVTLNRWELAGAKSPPIEGMAGTILAGLKERMLEHAGSKNRLDTEASEAADKINRLLIVGGILLALAALLAFINKGRG